jgi:predicted regulator of Ras-like GTPase activity (Roadblock/LC7/MglB family)
MLDSVLEEISRRAAGFRGVALSGMDGVPLVRREGPGGPDLDLCSAEYAAVVRQLAGLGANESCGELRSIATLGADGGLLVERVTDEYFLILSLGPEAMAGQGRYELRRAALKLIPELM